MTFLRVKQAQFALADGRLEEAFKLLSDDDVRSHRKGQKLATRLVTAYLKRGEEHLAKGRLQEALNDCQKAGVLGGHTEQVAKLRNQVTDLMQQNRQASDRKDQALVGAIRQAREGFVSAGMAMLKQLNGNSVRVEQAQQELDLQMNKAGSLIDRAEAALKQQDWVAAGHHLAALRKLRPYDRKADQLVDELTTKVVAQAKDALADGRMGTATSLLRSVGPVAGERLEVVELKSTIQHLETAAVTLKHNDPRSAIRELRRAKEMLPKARWIDQAISHTEKMIASQDALEDGPLGLLVDSGMVSSPAIKTQPIGKPALPSPKPSIVYHHGTGSPDVLPKQFIIQVDGAGAAYTTLHSEVTVGPVSSPKRPQVGLVADPGLPIVTIQRVQEDYFLRSDETVKVNGKPVREKLLAHGDKVELSPRCLFKFKLPHAASTTAVLELTGARMARGDVKRVIMLDQQMMLGSGPACHVRADGAEQPVLLLVRDGRMVCQAQTPVTVGGETYDLSKGMALGQPVSVGPVVFRVAEA